VVVFCLLGCVKSQDDNCVTIQSDNPIKVGILHSLTGTISGSETPLKDFLLYLICEQNKKGGILGRPLVSVVKDPESNWPLFAELARELITVDQVDVVFGCWTSVSRKSVLSVFEELDHLLLYPVQYEGEECSNSIYYTGAAPNQQAIPAVDYLYNTKAVRKFILVGTDYVYPRTTNDILNAYLKVNLNITDSDIITYFTPFSHSDWHELVSSMIDFYKAGLVDSQNTAIVSTINGDANTYFYEEIARQYNEQAISPDQLPIVAFSVGEAELASLTDIGSLAGHLAAWNYFMSINNTLNQKIITEFLNFQTENNFVNSSEPGRLVLNDPMEAHYIGFNMWVAAVEQAGTTFIPAVKQALYGRKVLSLSGFNVAMNTNHHLSKPVLIGKIMTTGQFEIIYNNNVTIPAVPWNPAIDDPSLVCDWSYPYVCSKCSSPTFTQIN